MLQPSILNPVLISQSKGDTMSDKMSIVAAIKLVSALGYTSGEPTMWKIVRALQTGAISPDKLSYAAH